MGRNLRPPTVRVNIHEEEWYPVRRLVTAQEDDPLAKEIPTALFISYNNSMRQFEAARAELSKAVKK